MGSDFSAMGRSARALIVVPDVPLDSIRSRSHAARARSRMGTFGACAALALLRSVRAPEHALFVLKRGPEMSFGNRKATRWPIPHSKWPR